MLAFFLLIATMFLYSNCLTIPKGNRYRISLESFCDKGSHQWRPVHVSHIPLLARCVTTSLLAKKREEQTSASPSTSTNRVPAAQVWNSDYILSNRNNRRNSVGDRFAQVRRRNEPWWMRDEERNNPRILPPYEPWWRQERKHEREQQATSEADVAVELDIHHDLSANATPRAQAAGICSNSRTLSTAWKISELRAEAVKRGVEYSNLKKTELLAELKRVEILYSLGDDNFTPPHFDAIDQAAVGTGVSPNKPKCYPEEYEGAESIEKLRTLSMHTKAPAK